MENIIWLTKWFKENCDGDWEHTNIISITTIDNPGWSFKVDITDTIDEGKKLSIEDLKNNDDWYTITCDGNLFSAYGDLLKLSFLIESFRLMIESPFP